MPLPLPDYYDLDMLPKRWSTTQRRVWHYAETGKLICAVRLQESEVEYGTMLKAANGREVFHPSETLVIKGFVAVLPEDCCQIFRFGTVEASIFQSQARSRQWLRLAEAKTQTIETVDLKILKEEVERFEAEFGIIPACDETEAGLSVYRLADSDHSVRFAHSDDYQSIRMGERIVRLGMVQAGIIKLLHAASQTNNPWIHGKVLLDKAGSRSLRLKSVFRNKPQWRDMIESDGRGYYRLKVTT